MKHSRTLLPFAMLSSILLAAACGQQPRNADPGPLDGGAVAPKEPLELTLYLASQSSSTPEEQKKQYEEPIRKTYPHFTLNIIQNSGGNSIANVAASKTDVDIILASYNVLASVKEYGLLQDMSDVIAANHFDINRLESPYIEQIRTFDEGRLSALPFYDLRLVLFYNKDIFDKFGVPYPKDGMTWKQLYETAKLLTRVDGGVQYYGFAALPSVFPVTNQYSLNFFDPKTNLAALQTDKWKTLAETYAPLYSAPGHIPTRELLSKNLGPTFTKEKTGAMTVSFNSNVKDINNNVSNWDAVTLPTMEDLPGIGSQPYPVYLAVSSTSRHRNEAFLAIAELLSDEVQTERAARLALLTALKNPQVKAAFGRNVAEWNGKNINAITAQKSAPPSSFNRHNGVASTAVAEAMIAVIAGEKDINTALREAEEHVNKKVESLGTK
ncbi:MAG: hypothetical protein K0R28_12 [Paenibacillus sp.]|nr:hypothetical protein [Paenibacillus sp.]